MKKIKMLVAAVSFCGAVAFLSACGGSDNSAESTDATTTEATADDADVAVDPNAKSDSKGVGKFTSVDVPATIDDAMAGKGQAIFETKCTPCHKLTGEKLVGPGLKNITNLRTPEWVMNMITNPEEMTKKDPIAKALLVEYNGSPMANQGLTEAEARQVLEYFRTL